MKRDEVEVGKVYHNGKTGNRSYSSRKVLDIFNKFGLQTYVEYEQISGRYTGEKAHLSLQSFAQWARGEVLPKAIDSTAQAQADEGSHD